VIFMKKWCHDINTAWRKSTPCSQILPKATFRENGFLNLITGCYVHWTSRQSTLLKTCAFYISLYIEIDRHYFIYLFFLVVVRSEFRDSTLLSRCSTAWDMLSFFSGYFGDRGLLFAQAYLDLSLPVLCFLQ
jgi:hypothetical protein